METKNDRTAPSQREEIKEYFLLMLRYFGFFFKWVAIGIALGLGGGALGGAFSLSIGCATAFRTAHGWIVWLLPLGGLVIAGLYRIRGINPTDTNGVLLALHQPSAIAPLTAPLIFVSTVITHLLGGSAGREGAALQMGGSLGYILARRTRANEAETQTIIMCGMSAVFAALFGSPLTATIFAMEVACVGVLQFSAIVPCLTSALTAVQVAHFLGAEAEAFPLALALPFSLKNIALAAFIAIVVSQVSIFYCVSLHKSEHWMDKLLPNPYLRIALGGLAIAVLTALLGTQDYNGAGMHIVAAAMEGSARPEAFLLKILFTVITVACGYKGGEIVPAMFIGSTLGCVLANLLGLDAPLGAAVGLLSMFCGILNCPISSLLLGVELFGASNIHFYAIACAVSYMLSANHGLYKMQKLMYSKLQPRTLNRFTK